MTELDLAADVVTLTADLCDRESVSGGEQGLADAIEAALRRLDHLVVTRDGNTVVARTELGRPERVILAGHIDTVPLTDPPNLPTRREGEELHGRGTVDMKGGVAVQLRIAAEVTAPTRDITFVFYDCEEVEAERNGLARVGRNRPELLEGDFAVLLEPTGEHVEAGCQGTLHLRAHFEGERAHSARPWKGRNAIHAAADVLGRLAAQEPETVVVDGLPYRESLQVVRIEGGVANNVVPDECTIVVNRRFAPKYSVEEARAQVEKLLEGADRVEVVNASPAAPPNLGHPLVGEFVDVLGLDVEPKLGWTDAARFASRNVPAVNFGPGDPDVAHTAGEMVTRASVEQSYAALARFLGVAG